MKFQKNGFTVVEALIVLTVIGTILIFELIVLQGRINQYSASYFNAYDNLKKASYNILADMYCFDGATTSDAECNKGPRPYPTTSEGLCNRLKEFINFPPDDDAGACNAPSINEEATNIGNNTLKFTASSGYKFYISDMYTKQVDDEKISYFVVYVDINGKNPPNKIDNSKNDKIYPDIVPFILTTRGDAAPAGIGAYSTLYMTSKILYPDTVNDEGTIITGRYSGSMSFNEAVHRAWGDAVDSSIILSVPFTEYLSDNNLAKKFFWTTKPADPEIENETLANDGIKAGCTEGDFNCGVIIDENTTKRF